MATPEIPALHLAREKVLYLKQLELADRICLLLNRCQKRPMITPAQIEELVGVPVYMTFPNDYQGVQRALTVGRWLESSSELGKKFTALAQSMFEQKTGRGAARFQEAFSGILLGLADAQHKRCGAGKEVRRLDASSASSLGPLRRPTSYFAILSSWKTLSSSGFRPTATWPFSRCWCWASSACRFRTNFC